MQDALEQKPDDVPAEAQPDIAPAPSDSGGDELDQILADFDAAVNNQNGQQQAPAADNTTVESFLADLDSEKNRATQLEGELAGLRGEFHRQSELAAFEKFSADLQSKLPQYLPPDYSRNALISAAATNPDLQAAWNYRGITSAQRQQADAEFRDLERLHAQVLRSPDDPRKADALAKIENAGRQLGLMLNSTEILRRASREIEKRASEFKPLDPDATADRFAVAASMREARAPIGPEPAPQFGNMTDNQLREYTKKNFGFV